MDKLQHIAKECSLGEIQSASPILTGYQDQNIDLQTSVGHFVIKIFSQEKTVERIQDVLWAYKTASKSGAPVPRLVSTTQDARACVFDYFDGKPLTRVPLIDSDLMTLTNAMSKIHAMKRSINHYYDTMAIVNCPGEYNKKITALSPEEQKILVPIIQKLQKINLSTFPQSIIHGTFEKENVLKNSTGDICLLDFGCMDFNASILDIATFIANFTIYVDEVKRTHITQVILSTYQKFRLLTKEERSVLPTLIRAQYAAYIIGMSYRMRIEHDMTKQTQSWLDRGWDGLRTYEKVKHIL